MIIPRIAEFFAQEESPPPDRLAELLARLKRGLSQGKLARETGVTPQYISEIVIADCTSSRIPLLKHRS
ncbi:MAG: helix-turn-helix transcriptional regulator, partial [Bacillota bacterium]|nr:helix-turn-helix transcriptional regulator [Bacillota bacterium]